MLKKDKIKIYMDRMGIFQNDLVEKLNKVVHKSKKYTKQKLSYHFNKQQDISITMYNLILNALDITEQELNRVVLSSSVDDNDFDKFNSEAKNAMLHRSIERILLLEEKVELLQKENSLLKQQIQKIKNE